MGPREGAQHVPPTSCHDPTACADPSPVCAGAAHAERRSGDRRHGGVWSAVMRAEATARLRLRVGAYEHRRPHALLEHVFTMLRGADESSLRLVTHATIIALVGAAAVVAVLFGL